MLAIRENISSTFPSMFKITPEKLDLTLLLCVPGSRSWWSFHPQLLLCESSLTRTCGKRLENLPRPPRTRKSRKKRLTMRAKIGLQKCRSSLGPSKAIVPSELVIKPFNTCCFPRQQDSKASNARKNTKKTKAPSKTLEMSIVGLMVSSQPGGA